MDVVEAGGPAFKEHVVVLPEAAPVAHVNRALSDVGVMGGLDLTGCAGAPANAMHVCVTENQAPSTSTRSPTGCARRWRR